MPDDERWDLSDSPTLAELAAEANRRKMKTMTPGEESEDQPGADEPMSRSSPMPWWFRAAIQFGVGTVLAFILVTWLQSSVDRKLDLTLQAAQETRAAQIEANKEMKTFATESARAAEIMLLVQRQTCANTAKTEDARDRCYATKMNGGM